MQFLRPWRTVQWNSKADKTCAVEPFLALDQKLACQFVHRACFLPHRLEIGTGSQGIYRTQSRRLEKTRRRVSFPLADPYRL
jgi:hypothetical protein